MKINTLPKALLVEVLDYLADYEALAGLDQILDQEYTLEEVRQGLRELSFQLRKEVETEEDNEDLVPIERDPRLNESARNLLSLLTKKEERKLLSKLGLLDS